MTAATALPLPVAGVVRRLASLCRDRRGISTVEFAVVAPVILFILAGTMDLGRALMTKFEASSAVSASTNYALLNASRVTADAGAALAGEIAAIASSSLQQGQGVITVEVNNGPKVVVTNGASVSSGTASNADSCYCPTVSGTTVTWGGTKTCGSACAGSGVGGKFVVISASKPYTPMFSNFGIIDADAITVQAIVQPQ